MLHRPVRLSWAKLLTRVFELDLAHCPNCGGKLKIIAAILGFCKKVKTTLTRFTVIAEERLVSR